MTLPRWTLWLCIALGLALSAAWIIPTPHPRGPTAPSDDFSAARAFPIIQDLARAPHPIGSPEHDRVRDRLIARMTALGLSPPIESGIGFFKGKHPTEGVVAGRVENLIGVLPGREPAAPALLLMAHYDSVPLSPGAADDMTGVASLLESVRALEANGPHRRDVVVVLSDGEEEGMLGAELFFRTDPLAARAGAVINAEARGDAGRVAMFQTGRRNGETIRLFARSADRPFANSVMGFAYSLLPNDTDFTHVVRRGAQGLNFAFLGDQLAYHTALSTPGHLDQGSLQHMGGQILGVARALADAPVLPGPAPDVVYSDVAPGLPMLVYPPADGWIILAVAAALLAAGALLGRERPRFRDLGAGLALTATVTLLAAAALFLTGLLIGVGAWTELNLYRLLSPYAPLFAGEALITLGVVLAAFAVMRRLDARAAWIGAAAFALALGLIVQALAPAAAILFAWPALIGAASLVLERVGGRVGEGLSAFIAVFLLAILAGWASVLYAALGPLLPVLLALFVPLLLPAYAPFLSRWSQATGRGLAAIAVLVVGAGLVAYADLRAPTRDRPALTRASFLADPYANRFAWIAPERDAWTRRVLAQSPDRPVRRPDPPLFDRPVWSVPAPATAVTPPALSITPGPLGLRATLAANGGGRALVLYVRAPKPMEGAALNGAPIAFSARANRWVSIALYNPGAAAMTVDLPARSLEDALAVEERPGWLAGETLPPRPENLMPQSASDVTYVVSRLASVR